MQAAASPIKVRRSQKTREVIPWQPRLSVLNFTAIPPIVVRIFDFVPQCSTDGRADWQGWLTTRNVPGYKTGWLWLALNQFMDSCSTLSTLLIVLLHHSGSVLFINTFLPTFLRYYALFHLWTQKHIRSLERINRLNISFSDFCYHTINDIDSWLWFKVVHELITSWWVQPI